MDLTYFPIKSTPASYNDIYENIPETVEVILNEGEEGLEVLLKQRFNFYDYILISRPNNLEVWNRIKTRIKLENLKSKLLYDAESIFSDRELAKIDKDKSMSLSHEERQYIISKELGLASGFNHVTAVSKVDLEKLKSFGFPSSSVLSYAVVPEFLQRKFEDRKDILFVGPLMQENCPNVDGLMWFFEEVFPLVQLKLGKSIGLTVVGVIANSVIKNMANVNCVGPVTSVSYFYESHRLAIAPLRIAAGISIKTIEAASYGTPVLCTSRIETLMSWEDSGLHFASDDPEELASLIAECYRNENCWEEIRQWQFNRVAKEFSASKFKEEVKLMFENS